MSGSRRRRHLAAFATGTAALASVLVLPAAPASATDGDGRVFAQGSAPDRGSPGETTSPVTGLAASPTGEGYWVLTADGGVNAFGDATFFGAVAADPGHPAADLAAHPSGKGYWLVADDGGVQAFGYARDLGSLAGRRLAAPIVGIASTPSGAGYWLVASDGGVFAFGDARYLGGHSVPGDIEKRSSASKGRIVCRPPVRVRNVSRVTMLTRKNGRFVSSPQVSRTPAWLAARRASSRERRCAGVFVSGIENSAQVAQSADSAATKKKGTRKSATSARRPPTAGPKLTPARRLPWFRLIIRARLPGSAMSVR